MTKSTKLVANTLYIEVSGSGIPEIDGLFVPSTAPPVKSESGTESSLGYWNGKMAWDRADGKSSRSPSLSYSNSYKSWRISRLDGHLAYDMTCDAELPPTDTAWHVYKMGIAPAPKIVVHHVDPRLPCPKPNVFFILGGPGSGKGTMCELAKNQLGWMHLSAGDLLRAEREKGGELADLIEENIAAGKLVPYEIIVELLKKAMEHTTRTTGKNNFLVDGFPRSINNLEGWCKIMGEDMELPKMMYFECAYDVLERRVMGRSKYSGRVDDNLESIKLLFDTFKAETLPTVEYFKSKNKCIEIDAGQERQVVYDYVKANLIEYTDESLGDMPLTEKSEMLLGLRAYPKK